MLPPLSHLVREKSLLSQVLRSAENTPSSLESAPPTECLNSTSKRFRSWSTDPTTSSNVEGRQRVSISSFDGFENLPREVLLGFIAQRYLQAPIWHLCQLGGTSPYFDGVYADEKLWQGFFNDRFKKASRSPKRKKELSPSARASYAHMHMLERNFREGLYSTRNTLDNPHPGVPVLDLRVAPGATSCAFAALRNGSVMAYDLCPERLQAGHAPGVTNSPKARPLRAAPLQELVPTIGGGPALCCLPIDVVNNGTRKGGVLAAGFALGRLGAWELPTGQAFMPRAWENAHTGRISALSALGMTQGGDLDDSGSPPHALLSAASDNLVKAWDLSEDRFGDHLQTFNGHSKAVVSVASSPCSQTVFLTGSHDRTMRLWDTRTGDGEAATVALWQQQDWVTCVDFHPTSDYSFFSSDKGVHLWDIRRVGGTPLSTSHKHRKLISRFRADPLRLASCSLDGCVKVSSLEDPEVRNASPFASPESSPFFGPSASPLGFGDGLDVCTLQASSDYVLCIDFDAARLFAGSVDGCVDVYDFSHPGHFSASFLEPTSPKCGRPIDVQVIGLQEIEV